jgi:WhiB family redox-sensing transcriptional regulator
VLDDLPVEWALERRRPSWQKKAACRGADSDIFFLDRGGSSRKARAMCARCPVKDACLDFALKNDLSQGIFGGMTPRQRGSYKRETKESAA